MNKTLKSLICFLLAIMMLVGVAACGKSAVEQPQETSTAIAEKTKNEEPVPTEKPKERLKWSILTYTDWVKPGFQAMIDAVNSNMDLNIELTIDPIAGGAQGAQIYQVRFAANEMPEVVGFHSTQTAVSQLKANDKMIDIKGGNWENSFSEDIIKSGRVMTPEGKVYIMPYGPVNVFTGFYNIPLFEQLGIKPPQNWDEMLTACENLKQAGKVPFYYAGRDSWTLQIIPLILESRDWTSMNEAELKAQTEKSSKGLWPYTERKYFMQGIDRFKELITKGYVNKSYLSDTYDMQQKALAEGEAGMTAQGVWITGEWISKYPDKLNDIGAFMIKDVGDEKYVIDIGTGIGLTTNCKDVERGKALIDFLASKDVQTSFFKAEPGIPLMNVVDVSQVELSRSSKDIYNIIQQPGMLTTSFDTGHSYSSGVDIGGACQDVAVGAKTSMDIAKAYDEGLAKAAKANGDSNWGKN